MNNFEGARKASQQSLDLNPGNADSTFLKDIFLTNINAFYYQIN
ncbi:hypothetical protein [Fodinibius sp.]